MSEQLRGYFSADFVLEVLSKSGAGQRRVDLKSPGIQRKVARAALADAVVTNWDVRSRQVQILPRYVRVNGNGKFRLAHLTRDFNDPKQLAELAEIYDQIALVPCVDAYLDSLYK